MTKVLFILKRREDYNSITHSHVGVSTGLYNSAKFLNDLLIESGKESKLVVVTDNNDIDREVTLYKPTHVIIEALWVVPTKFAVLQELHPTVKWIVRFHSEMPFMANEGIAMDWAGDYARFKNLILAFNAPRMMREMKLYIQHILPGQDLTEKVIYLPNYYPNKFVKKKFNKNKNYLDIGCFGAVRPLKNHLVQAFAAIEAADYLGKKLRFHINAGRIEMKGESIVHNLQGLFQQLTDAGHELINHQWTPREEFLNLCAQMDIGLQVSFSETFNIVNCDFLSQGVPIVGSDEIPWSSSFFNAVPTDTHNIREKILWAFHLPQTNVYLNKRYLIKYINNTKRIWLRQFA